MMKKTAKKIMLIFFSVILMISVLTGCSAIDKGNQEASNKDDDTIRIGMSFDSFVIERWQRDRDVFVSTVKDQGGEVLVQVADGDVKEQIAQIEYFIEKKMDAIVIVAVDCSTLSEVIAKAKEAGIYVISYDRMVLDADIDLLVTFDNRKVGELMAQEIVRRVKPNGRVISINGSEQDNNVSEVQAGFHSVIDDTSLVIVYTDYCPNWEAEHAYEIMDSILDDKIKYDAIMCGNDDIATMVYKALSERGMTDSVVMVGQDADLAACQRIVNGWQSMTVYKSVEALAREAANRTIELVNTGSVEVETEMDNGYRSVPSILLEPIAVTEENMDEVIVDGGFHLHNEVYGQK